MAKLTEKNRLDINFPDLCQEWDCDKNGSLEPKGFSYSSTKSVWWKCNKCSSTWNAQIRHRSRGFYKCFYCRSLAVVNPELAKEWHPTKNGKLRSCDVTCNDKRIIWWKCSKCGNEWESSISGRRRFGNGNLRCKKCFFNSNKDNSFAVVYPELAKEWHPTKMEC